LAFLRGHQAEVWCVAFSPDNKSVATGSWDATIKLWDLATQKEKAKLEGQLLAYFSIAFSPDGRRLAGGGADGSIRLWDTETGLEVGMLKAYNQVVDELAFTNDGDTLVSISNEAIRLWHAASWNEIQIAATSR
jgi:WD40 repeat protein